MYWLKKCPQCGGDLLDESDIHGTFIVCLQCGRMLTAAEEKALRLAAQREANSAQGRRRTGVA